MSYKVGSNDDPKLGLYLANHLWSWYVTLGYVPYKVFSSYDPILSLYWANQLWS